MLNRIICRYAKFNPNQTINIKTRMELHLYHKMFLTAPSFEKFSIAERS